jgi:hypothetical protein
MTTQQCRKVRWPRLLDCGCYVTGGKMHRRGQRWICEPCALAEIKTSAGNPPSRP